MREIGRAHFYRLATSKMKATKNERPKRIAPDILINSPDFAGEKEIQGSKNGDVRPQFPTTQFAPKTLLAIWQR